MSFNWFSFSIIDIILIGLGIIGIWRHIVVRRLYVRVQEQCTSLQEQSNRLEQEMDSLFESSIQGTRDEVSRALR